VGACPCVVVKTRRSRRVAVILIGL